MTSNTEYKKSLKISKAEYKDLENKYNQLTQT